METGASGGNLLMRFKQLRAWQQQQQKMLQRQCQTPTQIVLDQQSKHFNGKEVSEIGTFNGRPRISSGNSQGQEQNEGSMGNMIQIQPSKDKDKLLPSLNFLETMTSSALSIALAKAKADDDPAGVGQACYSESKGDGPIDNWDEDFGLQTVIFRDGLAHALEDRNNRACREQSDYGISVDPMCAVGSNTSITSESTDDTSNFGLEGVAPLSDSESNSLSSEEVYTSGLSDHPSHIKVDETDNEVIARDEEPLRGGLGGDIQSFEDLIAKTLDRTQNSTRSEDKLPGTDVPKRPFLKKGEGLKRFSGKLPNRKPVLVKSRTVAQQKLQLVRPESAKVKNSVKGNSDPATIVAKKSSTNPGIGQVSETNLKQRNNCILPPTTRNGNLKRPSNTVGRSNFVSHGDSRSKRWEIVSDIAIDSSIDASFQQIMTKWDTNAHAEDEELEEFEILEKAADLSISSSASEVIKLMRKSNRNTGAENDVSKSTPKPKVLIHAEDFAEANNDADFSDSSDSDKSPDKTIVENPFAYGGDIARFNDDTAWDHTLEMSTMDSSLDGTLIAGKETPEQKPVCHSVKEQKQEVIAKDLSATKHVPHEWQLDDGTTKGTIKSPTPVTSHAQLLDAKLQELNDEIAKFKAENRTLEQLRVEREQELKKLREELSTFQKEKDEELQRIERFKEEETRKLRHERRIFEKHQKALRTMPTKQEREDLERLKSQVSDLQEQLHSREVRWNAASLRLRTRIEELESENESLKEELRLLERERLSRWTKEDTRKLKNAAQMNAKSSGPQDFSGPLKKEIFLRNREDKRSPKEEPKARPKPLKDEMKQASEIPRPPDAEVGTRFSPDAVEPFPIQYSMARSGKEMAGYEGATKEINHPDGKVERVLENGSREIVFPNGTRKTINAGGTYVVVNFFNGDIKEVFPDQKIVYYYAESKTTHSTLPDGNEILEFPNGQIERHFTDGTKEIVFPDKTIKTMFCNGVEETAFPDGTTQRIEKDGTKTVMFANGQKETHTNEFKRREYPDGTSKTVYLDGRQETRYASGRVRVKDKDGTVLVDTAMFNADWVLR